ncbi:TonB-dependent receptor [Sphingopyxis sp. KK2]|uniref:TonB-dependent receptor n=1 Tax=Sphingopyxis sp. KK2 TaxID=1855727 RepID=UPI00097E5F95|nr:TonB-dependent receptor [Sphingopyxis sp. KK2]
MLKTFLCVGASAFALIAVPAVAQDAASASDADTAQASRDDFGEIIVTAQKREQKLQDLGISITAIDADTLKNSGFSDPTQLSTLVPGFSAAKGELNVPIYTLRGIGFNEQSLAATGTVSVYVDEVGLPYPIMTRGAALDLERVEIVKGPQGTLYGQNTTGGAINYIAAKPTRDFAAGAVFGYGRFNAVEAQGYVSGPLSDTLGIRVAARVNSADPWQKSVTRPGDRLGRVDQRSGRILLDWQPTDRLRLSLNVNGWVDRGDTQAPQLFAIDPVRPATAAPELLTSPLAPDDSRFADWDPGVDFARRDSFYQTSGRIDYDLSDDITLTSITAYSHLKTHSVNERDGSAVQETKVIADGAISSFSQELRVAGGGGPLVENWVVGANYSHDKTRDFIEFHVARQSRNTANGLARSDNFANQKVESKAIFGSVDWRLSDNLKLITGARYTRFSSDLQGCTTDAGTTTTQGVFRGLSNSLRTAAGLPVLPASAFVLGGCVTLNEQFAPALVEQSLKEDNVSFKAALEYKPAEDVLLYGSVTQGYKSGNFPTVSASSFAQYLPAVQEKLVAYEGGFKTTLANRSLLFNGAIFYYDYTDKQLRGRVVDPFFGTLARIVNIPKSHVFGAEAQLVWRPVDGLSLSGDVTYLKTKVDEYVGFDVRGRQFDFAGQPFSFSPKWSYNLGADYNTPIGDDGLSLFVGTSYAYRSSTSVNFGIDPRYDIPSYGLLGAKLGVENKDAGWRATLWADNITNKYYITNVNQGGTDTIARYAGMPATYGVRLSFDLK